MKFGIIYVQTWRYQRPCSLSKRNRRDTSCRLELFNSYCWMLLNASAIWFLKWCSIPKCWMVSTRLISQSCLWKHQTTELPSPSVHRFVLSAIFLASAAIQVRLIYTTGYNLSKWLWIDVISYKLQIPCILCIPFLLKTIKAHNLIMFEFFLI
jgi:hypothetical protein